MQCILLSIALFVGCLIHYYFNEHLCTCLITHMCKCRLDMKKGNYWVYAFLIIMNTAQLPCKMVYKSPPISNLLEYWFSTIFLVLAILYILLKYLFAQFLPS